MKKFKLEANEMLHRNELKSVFGGYVDENYDSCEGMAGSFACTCSFGPDAGMFIGCVGDESACDDFMFQLNAGCIY